MSDISSYRKKILFVITKSNWGGAQRYVFDLATHLPEESFEVVAALGGTGTKGAEKGLLAQKLEEAGVRTIFIESFMRDISLTDEWRAYRELVRIFKTEKPDAVHLNSSKAGGTGALAARMSGVKTIIFTAHGWPFLEKRNVAARSVIYFLSWLTALLATKVIVVSDYDLRTAKRMPFVGRKTVRIYNGVGQAPLGDGGQIRKAFPPHVKITGTVGELTKNKNQIALLKKAEKNPNLYVAIVGEGEDRKMLEEKIKEYGLENRVKLFGFLPAKADEVFNNGLALLSEFKPQSCSITPHAPYSVSKELFRLIKRYSDTNKNLISIHNQECEDENKFYRYKLGSFNDLYAHFGLDISYFKPQARNSVQSVLPLLSSKQDILLVHNTCTNLKDIYFIKRFDRKIHFCFCPNANLYIENTLPKIELFLGQGYNITLCTDSLASNSKL